jgi:predicted small lipoprotein YifL
MKRMVLLILVLLLLVDLTEDGCLGKANFYLPNPSAKTSVNSCPQPDSGQTDFRHEFAFTDLPESLRHSYTKPITLRVLPTI